MLRVCHPARDLHGTSRQVIRAVKLYLDLCCLNRPFDDQSQARVALESQAVVLILEKVDRGKHALCNSAALVVENSLCPKIQERLAIEALLDHADIWIGYDKLIEARAVELRKLGFKEFDAYHTATAERGGCDRLVTCDDRFLKAARRNAGKIRVKATDPIRLVPEVAF
jgi:predicted nucleic acid-binding protein